MELCKKNPAIDDFLTINEHLDGSETDSETDYDTDSDGELDDYFSDDNMVYKVNHLENDEWLKGYNSDGAICEITFESL